MVVFVCYTVPDYQGIDIEAMFFKEEDAKAFCEDYNLHRKLYCECDYFESEVK